MVDATQRSAIAPLRWTPYTADRLLAFPCHDGSGITLAEVNDAVTIGDYTGTDTNIWATVGSGVKGAGDGLWLTQATALSDFFDFTRTGAWLIAFDFTTRATGLTSTETIISFGAQAQSAGGSGTRGGYFAIAIYDSGTNLGIRMQYRDGEAADASNTAANQTINVAEVITAGDGATDVRWHIGIVVQVSATGALTLTPYVNNAVQTATVVTNDGTKRAQLVSDCAMVIGGRCSVGVTPNATERLGQGSTATNKLANLVLWNKNAGTLADAAALIDQLYKLKNEPPRGI